MNKISLFPLTNLHSNSSYEQIQLWAISTNEYSILKILLSYALTINSTVKFQMIELCQYVHTNKIKMQSCPGQPGKINTKNKKGFPGAKYKF